jgi:hypothetical protein
MALAMVYSEPEKTTHGKKSKTKLLLETKTNFSGARLSQARTVLACSTDLALALLAGTKSLDAAYGEAKKAKQQLDGKGVAKSRRAAKMRRRKRSAGDHNHAGRVGALRRYWISSIGRPRALSSASVSSRVIIRSGSSVLT